ncbi:MAG: hypothetical protein N2036_11815 [Bryobacteraceae bacterium]|nr:hypothetical protein [Bryobacteraceae bacterium]
MKHAITALCAAALLAGAAAEARAEGSRLRAEVPFRFDAGGHRMAPGSYVFEHHPDRSLLVIEGPGGRLALATVAEAPANNSGGPAVIFRKSAGGWRLAAVAGTGAPHRALVPAGRRAAPPAEARGAEASGLPPAMR